MHPIIWPPDVEITERRIVGAVVALFLLSVVVALLAGYVKVAGVAIIACIAMCAGASIGYREPAQRAPWQALDGVAGGAMIAAACVLLLPSAVKLDPLFAGIGVSGGLLFGLALHRACRRQTRKRSVFGESSVVALTVHSAGAGIVIGMLYARMPNLGVWLGLVIVAHKLPAGYAVARRLHRRGGALAAVALPACAVGITAVPAALTTGVLPASLIMGAACQGVATGIFLHVGLECVTLEGPGTPDIESDGWRLWLPVLLGMVLMLSLRVGLG